MRQLLDINADEGPACELPTQPPYFILVFRDAIYLDPEREGVERVAAVEASKAAKKNM
jgi:hypothetical protein